MERPMRIPYPVKEGNCVDEIQSLAIYTWGLANGSNDDNLRRAAQWLNLLAADHICGQGYIGCKGGRCCSSDHK